MDSPFPEAPQIQANLNTVLVGAEVHTFPEVDSTNTWIKNHLDSGAPEGLVVLAESQTAGRGRWGRSWFSRPGVGIYLSLWLQPPLAPDHLPRLTLLAGLAAVRAVDAYSRGRASLKWPNDVLLNGKKMAGILCEFCETSAGDPGVILGIGINVNHSVEDFPKELRAIATSLRIENGEPVDRTGLILSLLHHLDQEYQAFLVGGEMELAAKWSEHTDMFGQRIALTRGREVLHGTALGLDAWGNLRMRTSEGREMTFDSGEVTLQPPES